MRLETCLAEAADRWPLKTALGCGAARATYAELDRLANRFAAALATRGVIRGSRVLILLETSIETVGAVYGVLRLGAIFSIAYSRTKPGKLATILTDLDPAVVVSQRSLMSGLNEARAEARRPIPILIVDGRGQVAGEGAEDISAELQDSGRDQPHTHVGIDIDLAYVAYTSGSTGQPKGVMMTHQSALAGATAIISYLQNRPDDIILCLIPLSFDYGLYQVLMSTLFGGTVLLERSFAFPRAVLPKLRSEGVTGFPLVPTTASLVLRNAEALKGPVEGLRYITNTAAPLPPAYVPRLRELFPNAQIFSMYGLTENIRGTYLDPSLLANKPTSVGKPIPNTEAWIVRENGDYAAPGEVGELVIRGGHLFRGYWRNPAATEQVLRTGPWPWERVLYTGDQFKADQDGHLYFVGRKDDMIKSRGEKVSPCEIEDVLYRLAAVREAAVVGVPDEVLGNAIVAVVSCGEGSGLSEREVREHCGRCLEDYLVPTRVAIWPELPKTDSGKISRKAVRDMLVGEK